MKPNKFSTVGSYFAVMGIPNVGKSSIIRHIQKSSQEFKHSRVTFNQSFIESSPQVGGIPGLTKRVASTKVYTNPDIYMVDTPGIFLPDVKEPEVGLKMALCGRALMIVVM